MSKIVRFSKQGNMVQIPTDKNPVKWFFLNDAVIAFTKNKGFVSGDEVEFEVDNPNQKTPTITKMWKVGQKPSSTPASVSSKVEKPKEELKKPASSNGTNNTTSYQTAEEKKSEGIKRLAIGNMTSRALISLQGYVNEDNIETIAEKLYKKFEQLVDRK